MTNESVRKVLSILIKLQEHNQWQVRHGGLLGLKYMLAVRKVRLSKLFTVEQKKPHLSLFVLSCFLFMKINGIIGYSQDMAIELLPHTLPWILNGLQDGDDDVRAVTAAALLPVAELMGKSYPQEVSSIFSRTVKLHASISVISFSAYFSHIQMQILYK